MPDTRDDHFDPTRDPEARPRGPGRRVLVVDDSVDGAESLALLLRLTGHQARTVHDGEAALAAAADFRPEVVLLDIGLPRMDGYEVARRLRRAPGLGGLVIVAMTGYGQDEDRRKSQAAGFDAHLVKPIDIHALEALLRRPAAVGEPPGAC